MIVRPSANDTNPIYIASHERVENMKKRYHWWCDTNASSTENILVFSIPLKDWLELRKS